MARWKALKLQAPMPVALSGVKLLLMTLPKGVRMARPPALGGPASAVWQATQLPSSANWRPRASNCGL